MIQTVAGKRAISFWYDKPKCKIALSFTTRWIGIGTEYNHSAVLNVFLYKAGFIALMMLIARR